MSLATPILFCVFNRPELTARVFETIRAQRPRRLLVVQDGPRADRPADRHLVEEVRRIATAVDWPCELETCIAETNLGCKQRMASGISWGFDHCERMIILEDDCLPAPDFFPFCERMLTRYADDPRVLMISGDNFQRPGGVANPYYFSKYAHIWGWASWRRAWDRYDLEMPGWPEFRESGRFREICPDPEERAYWRRQLDAQAVGAIDSWDYPWMFAGWRHRAWTVLPGENLVSNLGFGAGATHTTSAESPLACLPVGRMDSREWDSSRSNEWIEPLASADAWTWQHVFRVPPSHPPETRSTRWGRWLRGVTGRAVGSS